MKFINNYTHNNSKPCVEIGIPYFVKYKLVNEVRVVIRLGFDIDLYQDVVMFFGNSNGHLSYSDYSWLLENYTVIGPVNSITVD